MSNKISLDFKVFAEYAEKLDAIGGDIQSAADQVLQNAQKMVTANIERDMKSHKRTGRTQRSILSNAKVEWSGPIASVDIGFDIKNGGLPSIFLMYGTPRMEKDQQLYDHIYGKAVAREMKKMTEKTMERIIKRRMGG